MQEKRIIYIEYDNSQVYYKTKFKKVNKRISSTLQ